MDYKYIKEKILILKEKDPDFKRFGAANHHYAFNPPFSQAEIEIFEKKLGVKLPEDYRGFIINIGDGGVGPCYGLRSLSESIIDFKLKEKPPISIAQPFLYTQKWNENWINEFDWDNELPDKDLVNQYMDVKHIQGSLEISHFGHGCTYLLIISGVEAGNIWFDGRADYGGIEPELNEMGKKIHFSEWYFNWLETELSR